MSWQDELERLFRQKIDDEDGGFWESKSPMMFEVKTFIEKLLADKDIEHNDDRLRLLAETENVRKRFTNQRNEAARYASMDLIKDLLGVVDDIERAANSEWNGASIKEGLKLTSLKLNRILDKHNIKKITSMYKEFNPQIHEAVMQVEDNDYQSMTILEEHQTGYCLHDRLVRASKVTVSLRKKQ